MQINKEKGVEIIGLASRKLNCYVCSKSNGYLKYLLGQERKVNKQEMKKLQLG